MLVTMKNSDLIDKLVLIADGDFDLVQEAMRVSACDGSAALEDVVAYIAQNRQTPGDRLIPLAEVELLTGLKKSFLYAHIADKTFPAPTKIGSATRWSYSEVRQWIREQLARREK